MDKLSRELKAAKIVADMAPFWCKGKRHLENKSRTPEQRSWDSAILASAEFVRRFCDYDEAIALQIHKLLCDQLPE